MLRTMPTAPRRPRVASKSLETFSRRSAAVGGTPKRRFVEDAHRRPAMLASRSAIAIPR